VGDLSAEGSAPSNLDVGEGLMDELAKLALEVGLGPVGLTKIAQVGIVQILYRYHTLRRYTIVLLQPTDSVVGVSGGCCLGLIAGCM